MEIIKLEIKGLLKILPKKHVDNRGKFVRYFSKDLFKRINFNNVQSNLSYNKLSRTLRGFHMQKKPYEEDKIITCVNGKIFFVVVDLRKNSQSYLNNYSSILDDKKNISIFVPKGIATAWITLKNNTIINYLMSEYYKPEYAINFNYKDPKFNIKWPCAPKVISKKDKILRV